MRKNPHRCHLFSGFKQPKVTKCCNSSDVKSDGVSEKTNGCVKHSGVDEPIESTEDVTKSMIEPDETAECETCTEGDRELTIAQPISTDTEVKTNIEMDMDYYKVCQGIV